MRICTFLSPAVGLIVVLALSGGVLLGRIQPAHAQAGAPETTHAVRQPVDAGDGWVITVQTATLKDTASSGATPGGAMTLVASLSVQNTGTVARQFPTYRLRLVNSSGRMQTDTWCGRDDPSLELLPEITPSGTGGGAACWTVDAADSASLVLYLDPPPGVLAERPVAFALNPEARAQPAATTTPAALAAPAGSDFSGVLTRPDAGAAVSSSGRCSPAYSLYANTGGGYAMPDCAVAAGGAANSAGSGAALRTAGVPACRLFPSAARGSTATTNSVPTTPVVVPAPTITSQGSLAGVTC
jgi:hypothetical protein